MGNFHEIKTFTLVSPTIEMNVLGCIEINGFYNKIESKWVFG